MSRYAGQWHGPMLQLGHTSPSWQQKSPTQHSFPGATHWAVLQAPCPSHVPSGFRRTCSWTRVWPVFFVRQVCRSVVLMSMPSTKFSASVYGDVKQDVTNGENSWSQQYVIFSSVNDSHTRNRAPRSFAASLSTPDVSFGVSNSSSVIGEQAYDSSFIFLCFGMVLMIVIYVCDRRCWLEEWEPHSGRNRTLDLYQV
jgi:hypothetical protein